MPEVSGKHTAEQTKRKAETQGGMKAHYSEEVRAKSAELNGALRNSGFHDDRLDYLAAQGYQEVDVKILLPMLLNIGKEVGRHMERTNHKEIETALNMGKKVQPYTEMAKTKEIAEAFDGLQTELAGEGNSKKPITISPGKAQFPGAYFD